MKAYRGAFARVAVHVEAAKDALLAGVPAPRREPAPLAEVIHAFEGELAAAAGAMEAWRSPETEAIWQRCREGLAAAAAGAERMRLEAPALDFESLVLTLGDLIEPLEVFADADRELRRRGRRGQSAASKSEGSPPS